MKVLHIHGGDFRGGSAKGLYLLHQRLLKLNVESKIFIRKGISSGDDTIICYDNIFHQKIKNRINLKLDRFIAMFYRKRIRAPFSTGFFGVDFTKTNTYKDADIIHLHWINNAFVNIKILKKINKPIVWTLRDMWPMTGGCHVAEALPCDHYKTGCGNCVQLGSNKKNDLSRYILNRKKIYFPANMKLVGISNWISEVARESELFQDFDIRMVNNNINTTAFYPINKNQAKQKLGIKTQKKIILAGATHLQLKWKGFEKYIGAISRLERDKYYLCFFGHLNTNLIDRLGFEYKNLGFLKDNISLRLAYSAANVFVAPSLMDSFGKTLAEAMACETPVVCFDATGPKDIVTHKIDGYKAKPFESEDLKNGIEWVVQSPNYEELCKNARKKVVKNFDSKIIARKYIKLYQEILKI